MQPTDFQRAFDDYAKRLKHDSKYPHRKKPIGEAPILVPTTDQETAEIVVKELGLRGRMQYQTMNCGRKDCHYHDIDPEYFTLDD